MSLILMIVTAASLTLAIAMAAVAWRVKLEEQRRAEVRVGALADAIDGADDHRSYSAYESAAGDVRLRTPALRPAVTMEDEPGPEGAPGLFATTAVSSAGRRRMLPTIAVVALIGVGLASTFLVLGGGDTKASEGGAQAGARLELLSLRHEQKNGQITVTGLVRNPETGVPLERITAVIFLFDAKGAFLASTRAPLDFPRLTPGEESPFTATVAAPPGLGRYRVSFRKGEGGLVPHVDRRERS